MLRLLRRYAGDFLHLLAPRLCPACHVLLEPYQPPLCETCRVSIEAARFPQDIYQDLLRRFNDQHTPLALSAAGARYMFRRGDPIEQVIYALKYKGWFDLGRALGLEAGTALQMFPEFRGVQAILPVPLHRAKRRQRGYNQSEAIAGGVARVLGLQVLPRALTRVRHTQSQTRLNATMRQSNVDGAFRVNHPGSVRGRCLLLCDDVLTTGATLNSCAAALLKAGAARVVAFTVAMDEPHAS